MPDAQPPRIAPCERANEPRPFWSVMIPTYRPTEQFLRETLASLLLQDRGVDRMQIEVVDDCSPDVDVRSLVERLGGSRVRFRQTGRNLGLAGCWNTCLAHARGEWVHVLHQDDLVLPGFYTELEGLIAADPDAASAFTRHAISDAAGHWRYISGVERGTAGRLENWGATLASWQRIECASIVVRRSAYVALGGFRNDLAYVLDWEMWARLALNYPVVYSPKFLATFRLHEGSESARLRRNQQTLSDRLRGFEIILANVAPAERPRVLEEFNRRFSELVWEQAFALFAAGEAVPALRLLDAHADRFPANRRRDVQFLRWRCRFKTWRSWQRRLFGS